MADNEVDPTTVLVTDVSQAWGDTLITVEGGDGNSQVVTGYDLAEQSALVSPGQSVTLLETQE